MTAVAVYLLVTLSLCNSTEAASSLVDSVDVYDMKGNWRKATLGSKPLSFYTDSLFLYSMELEGDRIVDQYELSDVRLDTIGYVGSHLILDMLFASNTRLQYRGKAMLMESESGLYEILLLRVNFSGRLTSSAIVEVGERKVLMTKSRYSGTSAMYLEAYWLWCDSVGTLTKLSLEEKTQAALKDVLPSGTRFWTDGRFDLLEMKASGWAFREHDHHHRPTGGSVTVKYSITDCDLVVDSVVYDPGHSD